MERLRLQNAKAEVREFIFSGNALFTVEYKSENRFTYKIVESKSKEVYFVQLLTGCNNESDYSYLGYIKKDNREFRTSGKSRISKSAMSFQIFSELFSEMKQGKLTEDNKKFCVYHEGRCGRCGRTLTVPESIEAGFGSECIKLMN